MSNTPDFDEDQTRLFEARKNRIIEESKHFRAALPELLRGEHAEKWVVFLHGKVVSAHDDINAAYAAGIESYGLHGGQVIAHVNEEANRPIPIEAFGIGGIAIAEAAHEETLARLKALRVAAQVLVDALRAHGAGDFWDEMCALETELKAVGS